MAIHDPARSGEKVGGKGNGTYHLDVSFLILWDIFNVNVLGVLLRKGFI